LTFLDTSAIYALADRGDANHKRAVDQLTALLASNERLVTHNYVLTESMALVQHRLGLAAALKLAHDASAFDVEWITSVVHDQAVKRLRSTGRRKLSLVDAVSFVVMKARDVSDAFAFDPHFEQAGFRVVPPDPTPLSSPSSPP
jgi:uncharacterized protein